MKIFSKFLIYELSRSINLSIVFIVQNQGFIKHIHKAILQLNFSTLLSDDYVRSIDFMLQNQGLVYHNLSIKFCSDFNFPLF